MSAYENDAAFLRACGIDTEETEQPSFEELEERVLLFLNTLLQALSESQSG